MPKYTIGENGVLMDPDGNPVEINGEAATVDTDALVQERLARQKKKLEGEAAKLKEQLEALQAQADRTPQLERLLEETRAKHSETEKAMHELEQKAQEAEQAAAEKVANQLREARQQSEQMKAALEQERASRVRDQVTNAVLAKAGDVFNAPALDVVPHLLQVHKREPVLDDEGKPIEGKFQDLFELEFEKDGNAVREHLPVDKALEVWAAQHPHHVRASGTGGSGGGNYIAAAGNVKRSQMSAEEKSAFIEKHGAEAFKKLPQ
jgi:flagellar biosynthesis GTPase FlhF